MVGQMFHVKHSLWRRWCSRRRSPRPLCRLGCAVGGGPPASRPLSVVCPVGLVAVSAGLLCVPVGGGPPASRPRRELRSARRLEARPGPATAHGHRSQALTSPTGTATRQRWRASWCPLEYVADRCPWDPSTAWPAYRGMPPHRCVGRALGRGVVPRAREGMQKVRSPCGSADLRGAPAWTEFAQWRSAFTMCLVSASSLS